MRQTQCGPGLPVSAGTWVPKVYGAGLPPALLLTICGGDMPGLLG